MSVRETAAAVALTAAALAVAACGASPSRPSGTPPSAPAIVPASLHPGDVVLGPTSAPAVRVTGRIAAAHDRRGLVLDRATLQRLGLDRIELYEPFKKRWMTFRAVPLANLLAFARPAGDARTLFAAALNDYTVDIPLSVARARGVYLAIADGDGAPIPVVEGGPFRVVFAGGAKGASEQDYWIWSLASIAVR